MATNLIQADVSRIKYTNAGSAIAANDVVIVENLVCVALVDIATNATGDLATSGVWELPKVTAANITAGQMVMWDVSVGKFDDSLASPATGDVTDNCVAWEDAGTSATTVKVAINVPVGTVA